MQGFYLGARQRPAWAVWRAWLLLWALVVQFRKLVASQASLAERVWGRWRFAAIYLIAVLGSGVMVVLTTSVIMPLVIAAGFDLVWFGIFIVLVVEMAQITPPVGFNLFVLQGMTKKQITWIARHALPMFYLMIVATLLLYFFPQLVTFLPHQMKFA